MLNPSCEQGVLEVGGIGLQNAEVLMAMSECPDGDSVGAPASESPTINKPHGKILIRERTVILVLANDSGELCNVPSPKNMSATTSTADRLASSANTAQEATPRDDTPLLLLYARKALGYIVTKHPRAMSTVSTVLITVGGFVLLPGVSACIGHVVFTTHAVQAAGAIAVAVGKWLKTVLDSTTKAAAHPCGKGGIENVDDGKRCCTQVCKELPQKGPASIGPSKVTVCRAE